ncbi:hypothetical protein ACU8KH_00959 [Lachancea thermotolerans]
MLFSANHGHKVTEFNFPEMHSWGVMLTPPDFCLFTLAQDSILYFFFHVIESL